MALMVCEMTLVVKVKLYSCSSLHFAPLSCPSFPLEPNFEVR